MRGALGGPRVLLRRLREVMAEQVSAQERLDKIVVLIAANMVAEVCSCYVLRVDGTLELYATEGLNREPHQTVLRADEGLVGPLPARQTRSICRKPRTTRPSPSGRRPARKSTAPSRRAGAARRATRSRAGGAKPGAAHLFRGGRGGAADHRYGARRDDRLGASLRAGAPGRARAGCATAAALERNGAQRRHRARPRRAARAARRHHQFHRR